MKLFAARIWLALILPVFLLSSHVQADVSTENVAPRIINGVPASLGEHDYFVALLYRFQWANGYNYWTFCGGSYLGNGTIVTAAHCVDGNANTPVYVLVGNNSADMKDEFCLTGGDSGDNDYCRTSPAPGYDDSGYVIYDGPESNLYPVTMGDFIVHQAYSSSSFRNDIALLQLDSAPSNPALVLPSSDQFKALADSGVQNSVVVIGHGDVISDSDSSTFDGSPQLLEATLTPKTDVFCTSRFPTSFDSTKMVCAGDTGATVQDSCQGDSGGPLFDPTTNTLLGIVSFGPSRCADPSTPYAVYTDVYQYVEWIESNGTVFEPPLAYEEGKNTIRLGNTTGSFGFLPLLLLPMLVMRKKR